MHIDLWVRFEKRAVCVSFLPNASDVQVELLILARFFHKVSLAMNRIHVNSQRNSFDSISIPRLTIFWHARGVNHDPNEKEKEKEI